MEKQKYDDDLQKDIQDLITACMDPNVSDEEKDDLLNEKMGIAGELVGKSRTIKHYASSYVTLDSAFAEGTVVLQEAIHKVTGKRIAVAAIQVGTGLMPLAIISTPDELMDEYRPLTKKEIEEDRIREEGNGEPVVVARATVNL